MTLLRARLAWVTSSANSLLRRTRTHSRTRRSLRARTVMILLAALMIGNAAMALAADGDATDTLTNTWGLKDSSGISIEAFKLHYETEGMLESVTLGPGVFFAQLGWNAYVQSVSAVLWGQRWEMELQLLDLLDPVASTVAGVLASTITRLGLVALAMALAVIGALQIINRGNTARGLVEIFIAMLIAAAAWQNIGGVILADVTGPGGSIWQARDLGSAISAEIATGGSRASSGDTSLSATQEVDKTNQKLVDALIRSPHQLLQYGAVLDVQDSGKCKEAYDTAMKSGGGEKATEAVIGCDSKYEATVKDPMMSLTNMPVVLSGSYVTLLPLLVLLLGFCGGIAWALWESVMITWGLLKGVVPGSARGDFVVNIMSVLMALGTIILTLAGSGIVASVIQAILEAGTEKLGIIPTYWILLIVSALMSLWALAKLLSARKSARKIGEKTAKSLAPQAKAMSSSAPKIGIGTVAKPAVAMWTANRISGGRLNPLSQSKTVADGQSTGGVALGTLGRAARGAGKVAGGSVALALKGTVGAPVYLPRAAGAAKATATRAKANTREAIARKVDGARLQGMYAQDKATAFAHEYTTNVKTGAAWVKRQARGKNIPTVQEQQHPQGVRRDSALTPQTGRASSRSDNSRVRPAPAPRNGRQHVRAPQGGTPSAIKTAPSRTPTLNQQNLAAARAARPAPVKTGARR